MKKLFLSVIFFLLLVPDNAFSEKENRKKTIVAGTAHVQVIVKEIAGENADVFCPLEPGMCPGHFDVKAKDLSFLHGADVIIRQGFERWIDGVRNIINEKQIKEVVISPGGNWMIPENHILASENIKQTLCLIDPDNASVYEKNFSAYIKMIKKEASSAQKLKGVAVICSDMQQAFLEWLGCLVIASYGRPNEMTSSQMIEIIKKGKNKKVNLVVDNLQSGPDAGKIIAEELGARHVTLTNFPLAGSYIDSFKDNISQIQKELEK
ncbi:MAG: metal ABC transporter substrate-binding protein [Candidatus Aureabacteria bacterium]|nr:metal ABC transporter substrate-binding protein [Candidatus Auribacterota bacterium]